MSPGPGIRLVPVLEAGIDMRSFVSDIAHIENVCAELFRNHQIPVLDVRIGVKRVGRKSDGIEERISRIQGRGDRVLDGCDRIERRIGDGETACSGRIQLKDIDVVELSAEIKDAVTATQHPVREPGCKRSRNAG